MAQDPVLDGRRVESLVQELSRYAPQYTPELNLADEQSAGPALMRIFAHLAETVLVRVGRTPRKHFIAFLDRLGINLLPARPARAAVTFRLSSDLTDVVRVPAGTRVTAAGPDDDISFETTGELMAIPGGVAAVYGADPLRDAIYRPPPGFLTQQIRTATELVYKVLAFTAAGDRRLQIDHVTELAPGSFLRIDSLDQAVVASIADGNIVTLQDPVSRDIPAATTISPIRDFAVFNGIDVQQHVLYLGHGDVFTVTELAEIGVDVELVSDVNSAMTPLDIAWQFLTTVNRGSADEAEIWAPLSVVSDGTAGLSTTGRVVLLKPPDQEIKEKEVSGVKSRWVRALLRDKLPAGDRALPEIDTITVRIKSDQAAGIPADQAFHNATPLDLQVDPAVGILPFGAEPRQFDQFYLASKEAFSKREAEVRLQFELDLQTLASPALAATTTGTPLLRAYSIGLRRKLYELQVDTGDWKVLGEPSGEPIDERPKGSGFLPVEDSTPSAFFEGEDLYVVVNTEDSLAAQDAAHRIWCFRRVGDESSWNDLGAPGPTPPRVAFGPAAVRLPAGDFARVFAVAGDGRLYSRVITASGAPDNGWIDHGSPPGVTLSSRPFVTITGGDDVLVFVNGGGIVHRFTLFSNLPPEWVTLGQQTTLFSPETPPFAVPCGPAIDAKVFVLGVAHGTTQPRLFECDTRFPVNGGFDWVDLGRPGADDIADPHDHAPAGFLEAPDNVISEDGKHIFLRGPDDHLYELMDGDATTDPARWEDRSRTDDPLLRDSPAVHADISAATAVIRVVCASGRNSLVAWNFELTGAAVPANGDALAVRLDEDASTADDHYTGDFAITNGPGSPVAGNEVEAYDGTLRVVRLTDALATPPDASSTCDIEGEPVSIASTDADRLLALHDRADDFRRARALRLRLDDDVAPVEFYSRLAGVVRLDETTPLPANYVLYAEVFDVTTEYAPLEDRGSIPALSWEYWNGRGWLSLPVSDATRNFLANGEVRFIVPESIAPTEVAGQENFWIRARLVGGDYGRETFRIDDNNTVVSEKSSLRPPRITNLRLFYDAPGVAPAACLTFNNLDYLNQTAACRIGGARFHPFEPLERFTDRSVTLFLGFERPFKTGPVRLLIDAAERELDESRPPELDWRFRKDRRWKPLDASDGTVALTRQGILTLSASEELTRETRFGQSLFWVAGSLRTDRDASAAQYPPPLLRGIYLNTVWALQGETITDQIIGSSDGEPGQVARFQYADVLEGEDVRVREALSAEEHDQIVRESGESSVVVREDLSGTWVRWRETAALFDAGPRDRCYLIDRAAGQVQFGDGAHGRIPPAGVDNIRTFTYRTGGGAIGNVAAGTIETLATAVAGVESVFNPMPAGGGSDKATTEAMLTIGPRRISHRDRAVSAEDFEELALEASRQVAKVRCLATTNLARRGAGSPDPCDAAQRHDARRTPGWVSLIVVPDSADPRPCPSLELRRTIKDFLLGRVPTVLADGERIVIRPPDYVSVSVEADIFVTSLEAAAAAESKARTTLETFLHPLRGGADGHGWEFGRPLWKSDVFAALEQIDEIDRVENLLFRFRGGSDRERVVIQPNELLASAVHVLAIKKA